MAKNTANHRGVPLSAYLPHPLAARITALAARESRSRSSVVAELLRRALDQAARPEHRA